MKLKKMISGLLALCVIMLLSYFGWFSQEKQEEDRLEVTLGVCIDGDTVRLKDSNGVEKKYRMLLIDTPESTKEIEPYGPEAAAFTCAALQNANKIEIQYQSGNDQQDHYGRELVWIFTDGELLQEKIARAGYLKKLYDNQGPFDYKDVIIEADQQAQEEHVGRYQ